MTHIYFWYYGGPHCHLIDAHLHWKYSPPKMVGDNNYLQEFRISFWSQSSLRSRVWMHEMKHSSGKWSNEQLFLMWFLCTENVAVLIIHTHIANKIILIILERLYNIDNSSMLLCIERLHVTSQGCVASLNFDATKLGSPKLP